MPLKLMYESSFVNKIYINGKCVTGSYDKKVWGIDNKEADISEYIKEGKNIIIFDCCMPDWNAPFKVPFFAVKGDFRLNADHEITAPRTDITPASWTDQGFRYYTGRGKYYNSFTLDPAEVIINGVTLPKRYWAPFTLTAHRRAGHCT